MNGMNYVPIATMILVCIMFTKIIHTIFRAGYTRVCMWIINNPMVSVSVAIECVESMLQKISSQLKIKHQTDIRAVVALKRWWVMNYSHYFTLVKYCHCPSGVGCKGAPVVSLLCCCQFIDVGRALCYVGHPCSSSSQEKRSTHIRVVGPSPTVVGPSPTVVGPSPTVVGPSPTVVGPSPTVTIVSDYLIRTGIRLCIAHHSII